ncbi:MAG: hypothetical protein RL355_523 [Actinomycetota bacterium]
MRPTTSPTALTTIAAGFKFTEVNPQVAVTGITHNSREVLPGDIYVALAGANHHGIEFVNQAIENGAVAIATDSDGLKQLPSGISEIELVNPRVDMATLAARVYQYPQKKLTIVGVTGTNGKTSVTHILQSLFTNFGYKVGVIGTVGTYIDGKHIPGARTTPESTDLYSILAQMVETGVTHVFMEVSSHALELHRVSGLEFENVIFTNLSQDHLDFHGTMENYFAAKAKLFTKEFAKSGVICVEDSWGQKLADQVLIPVTTVGPNSDWQVENLRLSVSKTTFSLRHNNFSMQCELPMIGAFNATNAAIAIAVSAKLGLDPQLVTRDLVNVHPVPGRSQIVTHNSQGTAIVDYAHTPEAVEKVLTTLREVCDGQLITVLGCGGDRDALKRPLMGKIAAEISDVVIVTDDNPRSEDPASIRAQVKAGIVETEVKVFEIGDRREAINKALTLASNNDVVAVLGKGHEQGQEIAGQVHPFDDVKVIQAEAK